METLLILFSWLTGSVIAGIVGANKKIGFGGALLISLFLSPLIGIIVALASKRREDERREQEMLQTQKEQNEILESLKTPQTSENSPYNSIADEIKKLKDLLDADAISEEEYEKMKSKLINQ